MHLKDAQFFVEYIGKPEEAHASQEARDNALEEQKCVGVGGLGRVRLDKNAEQKPRHDQEHSNDEPRRHFEERIVHQLAADDAWSQPVGQQKAVEGTEYD